MDIGFDDFTHGPFDTRQYIEYLGSMFGYAFTLDTYKMLPKFCGHEEDDPCLHLDRFEAVCGSYDARMNERLRFMFFPLSLRSVAGDWCCIFGDWTTWEQCRQAFIENFLPIHQTFIHGLHIKNFYMKKDEVFYKCWERFKILLETFPSHGLELGDIIAILYNALSHDLYPAFNKVLGREFLDLTPGEAWSFLEFFYELTKPKEKLEPSFEPYTLATHTEPSMHAPTSLDLYDPSIRSNMCVEPDYSAFAYPNHVPLFEGPHEEPQDHWPNNRNQTLKGLKEEMSRLEQRLDTILSGNMTKLSNSGTTISTEWDNCPNYYENYDWDELLQQHKSSCNLEDLKEQVSRLTQIMSTTQSGNLTELSTSGTTIGTELDNCPNYTGDSIWNEPLPQFPLDSPIQDISLPFSESQGDMQSFPTTELDTQPTLTIPDPIESLLTPTEHLNDTWPEEHIIESVDLSSPLYTPEVESGAHLSPLDLAPSESLTMGIISDYKETDHHWGKVVDMGKDRIDFLGVERSLEPTITTSVDFLGIERLIEPTMSISMFLNALWPHLRFHEPHLAFHPLECFTAKERPPLVLYGPEENILFLKPFVDVWNREGVG